MLDVTKAKELYLTNQLDIQTFYGHKQSGLEVDASCLSNWFPVTFTVNGITYDNMEQYMMSEKAKIFMDADKEYNTRILNSIMNTTDPGTAKKLGRSVSGFDDEVFNGQIMDILITGLKAKFNDNPELKEFLFKCKPVLVEASPTDKKWGIALRKTDKYISNPFMWNGANLLGFLLTEVRYILMGLDEPTPKMNTEELKVPEGACTQEEIENAMKSWWQGEVGVIVFPGGIDNWRYCRVNDLSPKWSYVTPRHIMTHLRMDDNKCLVLCETDKQIIKALRVYGTYTDCLEQIAKYRNQFGFERYVLLNIDGSGI